MVLSAEMSQCCYGANPRNAECKSLNRDSHTLGETVVICNQKQYDRMSGSYVTTDVTDYFLMFRDGAVLVCMHDVEKIRDHKCYDPTRHHEYLTVACKRDDLVTLDAYVAKVLGSNQAPDTESGQAP